MKENKKSRIDRDDPFASLIDTLDKINKQMDTANKNNESLQRMIEQTYKLKTSSGELKTSSIVTKNVYGKNAPSVLQEISKTEPRVSDYELKENATDVENMRRVVDSIIVKPFKNLEKSFMKMLKATEETTDKIDENNYIEPEKHQDVLTQKGFGGAMRRGMLDLHGDLPAATGMKEKIGRVFGKIMAHSTGISTEERKAYARESYYTELEHERAISEDPEKRKKVLGHEKYQLAEIGNKVRTGKIDLKGINPEKYMNEAEKQLVTAHNLKAIETRSPEFEQKNQAKMRLSLGLDQQQKYFEVKEPQNSYKELGNKQRSVVSDDLSPDDITPNKEIVLPSRKEREQRRDATTGRVAFSTSDDDSDDITEAINLAIKTGDFNVKSFKVNEFKIKTLTIESLIKPSESTNDETGGQAQNPQPSASDGIPDIDIDKSRTGKNTKTGKVGKLSKLGGMMGTGAKMLGKVALPLTAIMAGVDAVSGYSNAEENLGISDRKATFGEKMSSAVGGVVSGLTLGMIDEKEAGKGIANFFGGKPVIDGQPLAPDQVKRVDMLKQMGNEITDPIVKRSYDITTNPNSLKPLSGNDVKPAPDKKYNELTRVKEENDILLSEENKKSSTPQNNVIINSPTNIATRGNSTQIPTNVRPTHNAYERFVDRVFTA